MLRDLVAVSVVDGVYLFVILPRVETFAALCLVLLPAALAIGVLVSRPATFITGMNMGAFGTTMLALNNGYNGDFPAFANGVLAMIGGVAVALVITRLIRSVGAAWSAKRLLRAAWRDIAAVARTKGASDRAILTGVMMQRLGQMMPRLAAVSAGADEAAVALLRDLRVGLNLIGLQDLLDTLPLPARLRTGEALSGIAAFYSHDPREAPPEAVLTAIDAAMRGLAVDAGRYGEALMLLSGLRLVLFASAPPPQVGGLACRPPHGETRMIGEIDLFGVYLPPLLVWLGIGLLLSTALARRPLPARAVPLCLAPAAFRSRPPRHPDRRGQLRRPAPLLKKQAPMKAASFTLRFPVTALIVAIAAIVAWQLWVYYMEDPWTRDGAVRADTVATGARRFRSGDAGFRP